MDKLIKVPVIQAITRTPNLFGISFTFFGLALVICALVTLITKSLLIGGTLTIVLYLLGRYLSAIDSQLLDGLIAQLTECPEGKNNTYWHCKTYAPW